MTNPDVMLLVNYESKKAEEDSMRSLMSVISLAVLATAISPAYAWDPWGDVTNPRRIWENLERETHNVGRGIDDARREVQAQAGAPLFEAWLRQSRNDAARGAAPIPPHIVQQLRGLVRNDILASTRYKIGDPGVFNLANLSIRYGDANAVTLIDIVVFKNANDAHNDTRLWVHELAHVRQFRDWGVRDFTIRYLRDWGSVEHEANLASDEFVRIRGPVLRYPPPPSGPPSRQTSQGPVANLPASACWTQWGMCALHGGPIGTSCFCMTMYGAIPGVSR